MPGRAVMTENNYKQADPGGSGVALPNPKGTAPGCPFGRKENGWSVYQVRRGS